MRRRQWHPTPVLLPRKSHGWRSLVGCSPWGRWESDTTERLHFHFFFFFYPACRQGKVSSPRWSFPRPSTRARGGNRRVHGAPRLPRAGLSLTFTFHFHALEKEMATHSSVLAWRIPGMGEPGGCRLSQSRTRLKWLSSSSSSAMYGAFPVPQQ